MFRAPCRRARSIISARLSSRNSLRDTIHCPVSRSGGQACNIAFRERILGLAKGEAADLQCWRQQLEDDDHESASTRTGFLSGGVRPKTFTWTTAKLPMVAFGVKRLISQR